MLEKFDHDFTITLCSDFLVKKLVKRENEMLLSQTY